MSKFVHLHTHSHYSLLNALPKIPDLVKAAKANGMDALALTDNGNLYGAIEFYQACKKAEIKPILGIDAYVAARTRFDKQHGIDNRRSRFLLLAKNYEGYKNLIKIVTDSHVEGFYYKPRVDLELLKKYPQDLIAIFPSFSSEVTKAIKMKDYEKAEQLIAEYKTVYGAENVYLEITRHPEIPGHEELMREITSLGKKTNTPIMAAHDVYYISPDDRKARDTLMSIQTSGDFSERGNALEESEEDFSFISSEQAEKLFTDLPEALENTAKIAAATNLEIKLGKWYFPDIKIPEGKTHDEVLRELVLAGIEKRKLEKTPALMERVDYELSVIKNKGYANYFLTVSDLLRFAHESHILTTIRGSVAGSLVTYLAGITNVNPIEYRLPFERFLNPERPSAPDIDMDYADNRRDEVIAYARSKYGAEKVAQIGTFGTMMARGSVRDTARALGFPYALGDQIAKLIPMGAQGFPMTIDRALEEVPELKELYEKEADVKTIIDMAKKIEGCARHISVHAAGVVISPDALTEHVPIQFDPKGEGKLITQYDMHAVGEDGVGLLKFDFLGIKNLAILADAVALVEKIEGVKVDIENVPLDDKKTFEMLARGETIGLFQLNGSGMTRFLKELRPSTIHDINAMVALYRPGPMESIPQYIERKHNPRLVQYLDPRLKEILERSYGIITYQDDVMMTAIKLAGYSWLEADKLRKAMGKKIPAEMEAQKTKLLEGFVKHGMTREKAEQLWKLIEPFAAYGFNKCLTGDARIFDSETGKPITVKELYESKKIIKVQSMNSNLKLEDREISAVMSNGIKKVFRLKTRSGRHIKTTGNHPFFTISGWKNLENLEVGQRIALPRELDFQIKNDACKPHEAATLGYLLSEGNLCHPHGIYYYSAEENEIADFISYASQFKNSRIKINTQKSAHSVYVSQENPKKENSLRNWLEELGLRNKKATAKFVPATAFGFDRENLKIFLAKLWQGDGTVSIKNQQLFYATSSHQLAEDVAHLLLRFGIWSSIHEKNFKYRGGIKKGWTVIITHRENIFRFAAHIAPHMIGEKQKKVFLLNSISDILTKTPMARGTKDIIPAAVLTIVREAMMERKITVKEMSEISGCSVRLFSSDKRKIGFQRISLGKIAGSLSSEKISSFAESDVYWDEIVSIESTGEEMTYDLTVAPHHNFVANDIIVHNSHAASYGKVAYQTSYMKANFPAIYMAAVLTADSGDVEKIAEIIAECKRMKIPVLPPDINESFSGFTVIKGQNGALDQIRFGLLTIKNFGEGIANTIIEERKRGGKFKSLSDFLDRIKDRNLNKKSLEALIKCGAMDALGERGEMLGNLEGLLAYNKERTKVQNQDSLFGALPNIAAGLRLEKIPQAESKDKLAWEKELLGLYISGHPLDAFREKLKDKVPMTKIKTMKEGSLAVISGIIEDIRPIVTQKGDNMAFIKVADLSTSIEVVAFPKTYKTYQEILQPEYCISIKGKISHRNGQVSLLADAIKKL